MLHLWEWTALLGGESEKCLGLAFTHMAAPVWCKQDGKAKQPQTLSAYSTHKDN